MDKPLSELNTEELLAKRGELLGDREQLQTRIVGLMHQQAEIDNNLSVIGLLIEKAKRAQDA